MRQGPHCAEARTSHGRARFTGKKKPSAEAKSHLSTYCARVGGGIKDGQWGGPFRVANGNSVPFTTGVQEPAMQARGAPSCTKNLVNRQSVVVIRLGRQSCLCLPQAQTDCCCYVGVIRADYGGKWGKNKETSRPAKSAGTCWFTSC